MTRRHRRDYRPLRAPGQPVRALFNGQPHALLSACSDCGAELPGRVGIVEILCDDCRKNRALPPLSPPPRRGMP